MLLNIDQDGDVALAVQRHHRSPGALSNTRLASGEAVFQRTSQAMISFTTFPFTSVSRKSRPAYLYVNFS